MASKMPAIRRMSDKHERAQRRGTSMGRLRTLLVVALLAVAGCSSVTLYSFSGGNNGETPFGGLIEDAAGNIYGTTYQGGTGGFGTVFRLTPSGTLTVLHSFANLSDPVGDGANPYAGLVAVGAGNLYGTTYQGGGNPGGSPYPGCNA